MAMIMIASHFIAALHPVGHPTVREAPNGPTVIGPSIHAHDTSGKGALTTVWP
ncbi:hypothetical protein SNK05_012867 [Fusarium graminearum]